MLFDLTKNINTTKNYKLMSQTIIPRPIAWIVTENNGVINIAPFSYFIGLSSNPASVLVSIGHKADGTPKDTLANIRKNKKCTICMVEEKDLEKMHFSSKSLDKDESEAKEFDIETQTIIENFPPIIKNVPTAYFCELNQEINLGGGTTIPIVLNIKNIYVDDRVITDKERLSISFKPVGRVGGSYAFCGEEISAPKIP
jgi:flavin reductase (DIM6/NTAB) family NADH-FMN oxidoreductase RutF